MLTHQQIHDTICYILPSAQFALWDVSPGTYMGEPNPIKLNSQYWVDWQPSNTSPCPTLDQINAVDQTQVEAMLETNRKANRDAAAANDLSMVAHYNTYLTNNANTSLTAFLDILEGVQAALATSTLVSPQVAAVAASAAVLTDATISASSISASDVAVVATPVTPVTLSVSPSGPSSAPVLS